MSSTTIDKRIVQMEFDAKKFRGGVQAAMRDISDLKKSFNMTEAMHSILELSKATEQAGDFSPMSEGLTKVTTQFDALGVVGWTVINNLTTAAMGMASDLAGALFIDPLKTGLEEYETQLNAVQTILANTQKEGTTLEDVNGALDELNTYADLTIYNFTQMTNNIGKFTAAGVKLDTSVAAIKGISNLAALSGSDANQASTAMYQLSQAISTGSLKLQDWNSVVNAGMGGQVFQDALMETARVHGVAVDSIIKEEGSFRESLSKGWISSEILLETLNKLTGDLSDAQLKEMGYTEDQIVSIQKQAQTALDAATKIKTVTQLIDTMKEAMQSGWGQSWRIIFGDFEEAKKLWGEVAEIVGTVIAEDADARNKVLSNWAAGGGRDAAIKGFLDILKAGVNIIRAFKDGINEAFGGGAGGIVRASTFLFRISDGLQEFGANLLKGSQGLNNFKSIITGIVSILQIVSMVLGAVFKAFRLVFGGVTLVDGGLWALLGGVARAITAWKEWAVKTGYFNTVFLTLLVFLRTARFHIIRLVKSFLGLEIVQKVIAWFKQLGRKDLINVWNALLVVFRAIAAPFYLAAVGVKRLYDQFVKMAVVPKIVDWFKNLNFNLDGIREKFSNIAVSIKGFVDQIKSVEQVKDFVRIVKSFNGQRMQAFFRDAKEGLSWTETAFTFLKEKLAVLGEKLAPITQGIKDFFKSIWEGIGTVLKQLADNQEGFDYSTLFDVINIGLLAGLVASLRKIASGEFLSGAIDDSDFGESLIGGLERLEGTIGSFQNNIRADTLKKVATAILILAASILILTLINPTRLKDATAAIAIMVATLFGSAGALKSVKPQEAIKASIAIIGLAIAMNIAAVALKIVSTMDVEEITKGIGVMTFALTSLVLAIRNLKIGNSALRTVAALLGITAVLLLMRLVISSFGNLDPYVMALGLTGIAAALTLLTASMAIMSLAGAKDKSGNSALKSAIAMIGVVKALKKIQKVVEIFGTMKPDVLKQGLAVIGVILAGMAAYSRIVKTDKILQASVAMLVISGALLIMYKAVESFASFSLFELFTGLVGIGLLLLILAGAAKLMQTALPGAAAMVVMAGALIALGLALKIISSMSVEELVIGILAIAAVLGVFVLAGYLLTPVVPVLMAFGIALALIGAGAMLFGLGIFLAATGLVALAGASTLIAIAIREVGGALIEIMPQIGTAFAETIANFITTLGEKAPEISTAFQTIILEMVGSFTEVWPEIAELIGTMVVDFVGVLLDKFVELYGDITDAGWDLLMEFLGGIEDNIKEVVTTALNIITEFIQGITDGLPDVVAAAVELFFTFLEAIEEQVITEENITRMFKIGGDIAGNIISGIVKGIAAGVGSVFKAIGDLISGSKTEFEEGYEQQSPSKYTYRVGTYLIEGLINSLRAGLSNLRRGFARVTEETKRELNPILAMISEGIDSSLDYSPRIRPVLDLEDLVAGRSHLDELLAHDSIFIGGLDVGIRGPGEGVYSNGNAASERRTTVQYNQYNYSPKALDRAQIYRQTRTLVATVGAREFSS